MAKRILCIVWLIVMAVPCGRSADSPASNEAIVALYEALAFRFHNLVEPTTFLDNFPRLAAMAPAESQAFWGETLLALGASARLNHDEAAAMLRKIQDANPAESVGDAAYAFVWRQRGLSVCKMGDREEAGRIFDALAAAYGKSDSPAVLMEVCLSLNHKGAMLAANPDDSDAVMAAARVWSDLVDRFKDGPGQALRDVAAATMIQKGMALHEAGFEREARQTQAEMMAAFPEQASGKISRQLIDRSVFLSMQIESEGNRPVEKTPPPPSSPPAAGNIGAWRSEKEMRLQLDLIRAQQNNDPETRDRLLEQHKNDSDPAVQLAVAFALTSKAGELDRGGDPAAAARVYDECAALYREHQNADVRGGAALAMFGKGSALARAGDEQAALRAYADLIEWNETHRDVKTSTFVAAAMLLTAQILERRRDVAGAAAMADRLVGEFQGISYLDTENLVRQATIMQRRFKRAAE